MNHVFQAMNGSQDLGSQQVDDVLYVAVHLQPMAVQVLWLEKIECQRKHSYHFNSETYDPFALSFVPKNPNFSLLYNSEIAIYFSTSIR